MGRRESRSIADTHGFEQDTVSSQLSQRRTATQTATLMTIVVLHLAWVEPLSVDEGDAVPAVPGGHVHVRARTTSERRCSLPYQFSRPPHGPICGDE
jgi:hypothetical protein